MVTALCVHSYKSGQRQRLGILGGTFDPIHRGHLELARLALDQAQLDHLLLVPCHLPPHRQGAHANAEQRLAMARLATAGQAAMDVSDFEIRKHSTSYSVETLTHFQRELPGAELYFCLGGDSLRQFTGWHRWLEILQLANLVVLARSADDFAQLDTELTTRLLPPGRGLSQPAGQILRLEAPELAVSATEIRQRLHGADAQKVRADDYLQNWLHPDVLKYISEHQVYE